MLRRTKRQQPVLVVHFGDMHIGGSTALCPPEVRLDDGGTHTPSALGLWYWECWQRFWQDTAELKKKHRARCVGICGGDERDGDHHGTTQLWAANENDQTRAVYQVLDIAKPVIDEWVFIRGTPAHDGPASAATEQYAEHMAGNGCQVRQNGDLFSWWIWTGELGGVRFEVAHAPGTKSWVPHTRGIAAARHASYTWHEYMESGIEPPDVVVRHHIHYQAGPGCHCDTCCYFIPAWQAATNWVKSGGIKSATVSAFRPGGLRILCDNGAYQHFWKLYQPPSRVAWAK